jgi:putative membrane protein
MMGFLLRAVITAIGLWLASQWVAGVHIDSTRALIFAAILLGLVNAIVRPIAFILTLPITILTLGLFLLVLNAVMVWLVQKMVPGFHAPWFMPAFLTSLIVWLVSWVASWLIGQRGFERYARHA